MESEAGESDMENAAGSAASSKKSAASPGLATDKSLGDRNTGEAGGVVGGPRQDSEQREIDEFEAEERRLLEEEGEDSVDVLARLEDDDKNISEDSKVN